MAKQGFIFVILGGSPGLETMGMPSPYCGQKRLYGGEISKNIKMVSLQNGTPLNKTHNV